MKPRPFDYIRPDTVAEAVELLAQHGESARLLAGGQTLMAMLNLRLLEPGIIVDIGRLKELSGIQVKDGWLEVGASVTQNQLLAWDGLAQHVPLLAKALPWVGHFQTRNRGTICGSLCHADPSSEMPLSLAVLGGEVVLRSRHGERRLPAAQFQSGLLSTARKSDEMVVAARYPLGKKIAAFTEVARRHGDFAIVAVAAIMDGDKIRLGVGGVADRPAVITITDKSPDAVTEQLNTLAWQLNGYDDVHATARYRRDLLRRLGARMVQECMTCAS